MSYLTLEWEEDHPVHCRDQLTLTEFSLIGEPIATEGTDNFDFDQDASGDFRELIQAINTFAKSPGIKYPENKTLLLKIIKPC